MGPERGVTALDILLTEGTGGTYVSLGYGGARFSFGPLTQAQLAALASSFEQGRGATTTYSVPAAADGVADDA